MMLCARRGFWQWRCTALNAHVVPAEAGTAEVLGEPGVARGYIAVPASAGTTFVALGLWSFRLHLFYKCSIFLIPRNGVAP
jgi:hypothetical protein